MCYTCTNIKQIIREFQIANLNDFIHVKGMKLHNEKTKNRLLYISYDALVKSIQMAITRF